MACASQQLLEPRQKLLHWNRRAAPCAPGCRNCVGHSKTRGQHAQGSADEQQLGGSSNGEAKAIETCKVFFLHNYLQERRRVWGVKINSVGVPACTENARR